MDRVIVGMSGGVDSSVAALLLKEEGYEVVGVFMKNWEERDEEEVCTATQDFEDMRRVCGQLDIPYYSVNFSKEYWDRVFSYFLEEYRQGRTPNPDVLCNREIKFSAFLDFALKNDARYMATGHFARKTSTQDGVMLLKGSDPMKDQSYFLYMLSQYMLKNALFPVGGMVKGEVRAIAKAHGLATAEKRDSTGVCFIGERDFKRFLMTYMPAQPGDMVDESGHVVGQHDGLMFYTIGQRKGLGLGGSGTGEPWFVAHKDMEKNALVVVQGNDHPKLYSTELWAKDLHWVLGAAPVGQGVPFRAWAKVRYRQADQACVVTLGKGGMEVRFDKPQRAVTPGQSVVLYQGEVCLGGGIIAFAQGQG